MLRSGARTRRGSFVVHVARDFGSPDSVVGLIVGKTVGGSVVRHRVSRQLRHAMAARIQRLPAGSGTVVRALPGAANASWDQVCRDLDAALDRLVESR